MKLFKVKPFPHFRDYYEVRCYDNFKAIKKAFPDTDGKGYGALFEPNAHKPNCIGILAFYKNNLAYHVISHESLHAALAFFRKRRFDFNQFWNHNYKQEEKLCFIQDILISRILTELKKFKITSRHFKQKDIRLEYQSSKKYYEWKIRKAY